MMVCDMRFRAGCLCAYLDLHISDIFAGRDFDGLTENAAFNAYDEDISLKDPVSVLKVFFYDIGALRSLLYHDQIDDLPTEAFWENNRDENSCNN